MASTQQGITSRILPLPENIDIFFLLLRLSTLVAGLLWYFIFPHSSSQRDILVWLIASYTLYSCLLYAGIFRWPSAIRGFYLTTLVIDLIFVFTLVHYVGYLNQSFFIGFYLIAAIHSFYFGLRIGLLTALLASLLYAKVYYDLAGWLIIPWPDFVLRITFLFLISLCLGLLAEREKGMRVNVEELNRELARKNSILEQSYRHLSIGRLIGEIAEGINSPCGLMALRSEVLMQEAKEKGLPAEFVAGLEVINRCSHEVGQIIKSLLNFSKHNGFENKILDINQLIEETLLLTQKELGDKGVKIERHLAAGLPKVQGDSSELKGVLIHLISNAMEALPQGGTISVATHCGSKNRGEVICAITDTGTGIPEEHLERIFNPFFTTKDKTGGIGLGLSTSLSVMKKHNGMITVQSKPGRGSTFSLALPSYRS